MTKAIKAWTKRNKSKFQSVAEKNHLVDFLKDQYGHKGSINFSYEVCVSKADAWVKSLHKKANLLKTQGQFETFMTFPDGYTIVRLKDNEATLWEGKEMGHCVGSRGYKPEDIYSVRDAKGMPHVTLEIRYGCVEQIQGKENRAVIPKYVPYIKALVDLDDLGLAAEYCEGFLEVNDDQIEILKEMFDNVIVVSDCVHKGSLKEKKGADFSKVSEVTKFLDGHTAPTFYLNDLFKIGVQKMIRDDYEFSISFEGMEHLLSIDKEKAFLIYQEFKKTDSIQAIKLMPTLYRYGFKEEVAAQILSVDKIKGLDYFAVDFVGPTFLELINLHDPLINKCIGRIVLRASLSDSTSFEKGMRDYLLRHSPQEAMVSNF